MKTRRGDVQNKCYEEEQRCLKLKTSNFKMVG
jgi:hypothetical protein